MKVPPHIDGTVLISESNLEGVESGDGALNPYAEFQRLKPVAILQDGVYTYKGNSAVHAFETKLRRGMDRNGVAQEAQEEILQAISSFAQYGFPESHAASFALIAYASAWLKFHYLGAFTAAILNNQPIGFYSAAMLVKDAQRHGLRVQPVADYTATGVTVGRHPMAHYRRQSRHGVRTRIAGCVIARQRPGTAHGFIFLSIEDETGIANAIVNLICMSDTGCL